MAKSRSSSKASAKVEAPALKSVKAGRVTKPAEDSKKKSKDVAKSVAKKVDEKKKRKDSLKEESESDSDSATSESSDSSDSDSEMSLDERPAKVTAAKKTAKAAKAESSESESSSSDSEDDSSDSEAEAPKANGVSKKAAKKEGSSDSEEDSEDSDASESEAEKPATNGAKVDVKKAAKDDSSDDASSDNDSEEEVVKAKDVSSDSEADSEDGDSDSSEDEKPAKKEPETKKRKAEAETTTPVKRMKPNGEPLSEPSKNLFVGSLSWNVDEDWLAREFEGFGEIVGVRVITRPEDGKSKGFGYVEFGTIEEATAALDAKQGAEVDGRNLNIDFGKARPDRSYNNDQVSARAQKFGDRAPAEPSSTLFVGNISFNADQDTIAEAFSEYGTVNGVRLPTDPDSGQMKGFGYVEFGSIEEAQSAMEALNGADIAGRNIRLDFAGARPANNDSPRGGRGRGGFGGGRGRGGFGDRGGRGGGRGRGGPRGGRGNFSTNRGGFGDFKGKKISF